MKIATGITLVLVLTAASAQGADTVETWDVGATDVDFYMGVEGLGLPRTDGVVFGDMMLGYGLVERFSAYFGMTLRGDRNLGPAGREHYFGVFGTAYESDHLDLDCFLDISAKTGEYSITPSVELNLDGDPGQATYGAYVRSGLVLAEDPADPLVGGDTASIGTTIEVNPGVYWTASPGSQFFLEYSTGYLPNPTQDESHWATGHLHVGYNRGLVDAIELITELNFAMEKEDDARPWGGFVGIIVTMPSGATR